MKIEKPQSGVFLIFWELLKYYSVSDPGWGYLIHHTHLRCTYRSSVVEFIKLSIWVCNETLERDLSPTGWDHSWLQPSHAPPATVLISAFKLSCGARISHTTQHLVPPLILEAYSIYPLCIPYIFSGWVESLRFFYKQEQESPWQNIRLRYKYGSLCNMISNFKYLHGQEDNMDIEILYKPVFTPPFHSSPSSFEVQPLLSEAFLSITTFSDFSLLWVSGIATTTSLLSQSNNLSFL